MPEVGFCLSIRVHPANPPLLPVLYVFTLGSVNATASSRVSALQWSWPFGPIISRNLYQSRGCYGVTKCPFVGQGGRCKVQENPIGLPPTTYIYIPCIYDWDWLVVSVLKPPDFIFFGEVAGPPLQQVHHIRHGVMRLHLQVHQVFWDFLGFSWAFMGLEVGCCKSVVGG